MLIINRSLSYTIVIKQCKSIPRQILSHHCVFSCLSSARQLIKLLGHTQVRMFRQPKVWPAVASLTAASGGDFSLGIHSYSGCPEIVVRIALLQKLYLALCLYYFTGTDVQC